MDTLTTSLRLLANNIDCEDGVAIAVVLQAAGEIERLRDAIRRLAEQDATLSVVGGNVTVTMDATLTDEIARLRAERDTASHQAELNYQEEIERLRLTDAERAAIQRLIEDYEGDGEPASAGVVATLRGLLERTK